MAPQSTAATDVGIGGRFNWLIGGALGGLAGATLFGAILWLFEPQIVEEVIPAVYGIDAHQEAGWLFHLIHGLVLGAVFGLLITREPITGTLTADVETPFLARMGPGTRITLAGMVYGLAIWVFLPGLVTSILFSAGVLTDPFPAATSASLVGHLLYGLAVGAFVSIFVDLESEAHEAEAPFEEAADSPADPPGN